LSTSDDNPSIINKIGPSGDINQMNSYKNLQSENHEGFDNSLSAGPPAGGQADGSSHRPSDVSGRKQILSDGAISTSHYSKDSIEFDLLFDICGIEMNVVQIKKKVRI